jgi:hypothetical protein
MVFTKYIHVFCKSKLLDIRFEIKYMGMSFLQKKKRKVNQHLIYIIHISKKLPILYIMQINLYIQLHKENMWVSISQM